MAEHPDPTHMLDGLAPTDEILAVLAEHEPHGATAEQVARTLGLDHDLIQVQDALEDLVEWGVVDRRGIGYGAVYTLNESVTI